MLGPIYRRSAEVISIVAAGIALVLTVLGADVLPDVDRLGMLAFAVVTLGLGTFMRNFEGR